MKDTSINQHSTV